MASKYDHLKVYDTQIRIIEKAAMELIKLGEKDNIPALKNNSERILASVKTLKINISDILDAGI
jgi:hypothetical protein